MNLHETVVQMGERAVGASRELARLSARRKNAILEAMAGELDARRSALKEANARDMSAAAEADLPTPMRDRLELTDARIDGMIKGLRSVVALKDPVGTRISRWIRPNGLEIQKIRVPIGVIAIVYESRPNVTADTTGLCFKTANAVILRGGKEAVHSNQAIAGAMIAGGGPKGLPEHAIQLVESTDREAIRELVQLAGYVDLAIPRGGEGLIRFVTENARVPVIKHYKGVCHVFVDESAEPAKALSVCENAKCQYPAVCNAVEKILIHQKIAPSFLPALVERLGAKGVEFRGDEASRALVRTIKPAAPADWTAEYLDLIVTVGIVPDAQAAVDHINRFGSHHSDSILTASEASKKLFAEEVDSAAVYINASTRFTDGGEFGMGAEIGISTDKIHARGPMGLEELTSYKYVVYGSGQIRE